MLTQISRRQVLALSGISLPAFGLLESAQVVSPGGSGRGLPGLYRGRVVKVAHAGSIVNGQYQAGPIEAMMRRGMAELTGQSDWGAAWKQLVQPGEVVGIKLNPVGGPLVMSDATVVHQIVSGLNAAGIPNKDIVLYDRYRDQFLQRGFDKWMLPGMRWSSASATYDGVQQSIEGYDPEHYMEMALALPGRDPDDPAQRRSYAARFITKEVDKLINLCMLKDHQSAGVTLSLKNLSHGLVNNVARSHATKSLNTCGAFIPAVVSMPVIRRKAVLHVLDGVKGLWHGGPSARPQFVWEHKAMYFATDPVALDRIGWEVLDEERLRRGREKLAHELPDEFSTFVRKQPEHVELAGALGLGEWEREKIDLRTHVLG